mgnify:CR=1 FL=1
MSCPDLATIDNLRPLSVSHENSKLYAMLKQCMANNEELRQALIEAAETIEQLTKRITHES